MKYFAKFDEEGNRITTIVEGVHFEIVPPQPIVEYVNGKEIFETVIEDVLDDEGNIIGQEEKQIGTGKFEQIEKIVGYTEEKFEPPIPEGYIEISAEEQKLYQTNEYMRGKNGKPKKKPPYVPTSEELKQRQLEKLEREYQSAVAELQKSLAVAQLRNDTALIADIRNDFSELQTAYQEQKGEIENGVDSTETV
jgi:hypothetical protein